jgi:hypothetical protein
MTNAFSERAVRPSALPDQPAISGLWVVGAAGDETDLDALAPIEREGARYAYREAGRPFGPGREGLETWLELRARGNGHRP